MSSFDKLELFCYTGHLHNKESLLLKTTGCLEGENELRKLNDLYTNCKAIMETQMDNYASNRPLVFTCTTKHSYLAKISLLYKHYTVTAFPEILKSWFVWFLTTEKHR